MLKVAVIILSILFIYSVVVELICIIRPTFMLESFFQSVTGDTLAQIQDADYLKAITILDRAMAFYAFMASIAATFILFTAFRKAQKWAWWALLIVGAGGWLWGLIDNLVVGGGIAIPIYSIGTVIFLVGIFLPVKTFFAKPSQQA